MFAEVKDMLPVSGDGYDAQIILEIKACALDLTRTAEISLPGVISITRTQNPQTGKWTITDSSTVTDELVPVENSYLMAMALKQAGVSFEHHVFPKGRHGLSLANEDWAEGRFGEPYVMEQMTGIAEAAKNGEIKVPPEALGFLNFLLHPETADASAFPASYPVKEVAVWPDLADVWMKENCFVNQ